MPIGVSVTVQGSVPDPNFSRAITRSHGRVARLGAQAALNNLMGHYRTGETVRGLRTRLASGGVEWSDGAPGGFFLEKGTKPHPIFPKNAKALRWFSPTGEKVFRASVAPPREHPGQPARPWLKPAIVNNADRFMGIYGDAVEDEFRRG